MKDTRRSGRYVIQLKAQYFLDDDKDHWRVCTILNINPKGVCVEFNEGINVDSTIHLVIIKSGESEPIIVKGILKWLRQKKSNLIGGIELAETLDENTFAKLS